MDDIISRKQAIDEVQRIGRLATLEDNDAVIRMSAVEYILFNLPPARPEIDEWCHECKEFDTKNNCCPRFNRVIRDALKGRR